MEPLSDSSPSGRPSPFDPVIPAPITWKTALLHAVLFVLTFASCAFSGAALVGRTALSQDLVFLLGDGAVYAALLLAFLGVHEFGHYLAARYHGVDASLPYFIPAPFIFIGTLGAVIRIRSFIARSQVLFDIGIAGPLAGFVVSLGLLLYGIATVPGPEFMYGFSGHENLHRYIAEHGAFPDAPLNEGTGSETLMLGEMLLFNALGALAGNLPPLSELYHYPWLFAGWLGLFFTGLNLMPIGQLDGGHVIYAMFGPRVHTWVARGFLVVISGLAGAGMVPLLHQELAAAGHNNEGTAWLIWAVLTGLLFHRGFNGNHTLAAPALLISLTITAALFFFVTVPGITGGMLMWALWTVLAVFIIRIEHPPVLIWEPLTGTRRILGWLAILIFVVCISPYPIYTL